MCYTFCMNAQNFDALMQKQMAEAGKDRRLLLHCCCAPCSTACLERLKDVFKVTVLFYNPNIEEEEYARRKAEMVRFLSQTGWADMLDCDHEAEKFYAAARGLEDEREGGARCLKCFALRLTKTAAVADSGGFDYFTTTLTVSPLKDAAAINAIGARVQKRAAWLYCDFKKRDGYLNSIRLSAAHRLYRQDYCGCVFSRRQR